MRSWFSDSIAGRTMIVLFVGLTLSHAASTAVLSSDRHDAMIEASERLSAEHVAALARFLDRAPPDTRHSHAAALSMPSLTVFLSEGAAVDHEHADQDSVDVFRRAIRPFFDEPNASRLHVVNREFPADPDGVVFWKRFINGFPEDRMMRVSLQLSDGGWANFDVALASSAQLWSPHVVASTLLMMVATLVLSLWATGWVGRPLAIFAKAADRLGRDVSAPPLPEDGPREVRWAVASFNEMQGRIRRFVEDRTRMLAAISHDLRSPITRARLRAEKLPDAIIRERLLADLHEMETMVSATVDLASGEAVAEPSRVIDLAATLAAICDDATEAGCAASYEWNGHLICTGKPLALKRALVNLVENAARYGTTANVAARLRHGGVEIIIDDLGPGIPEKEWENVFRPFYRLEASRNRATGGVGLGMTVARSIIRAHGGDIVLSNRQEGGLRVTVILPQEGGAMT